MELRCFGRSGLQASLAGLGCNTLGWWVDEAQGRKVVAAALDAGITLFDTADMYDDGTSETILGRALGARRPEAVVVTKFGMKTAGDRRDLARGSRSYIMRACEGSLKRLGSDYIDLYLHHAPDPMTPLDETLDALDRLIDQGKIRYGGCSNYAGWQIADAFRLAEKNGLAGFVAAQNEWNLLARAVEAEVVPAARRFGLGVMPYFPLAMGLLTGKYARGKAPPKASRLAGGEERHRALLSDERFDRVERLRAHAARHGHSLLELAIGWLASQEAVATVICGATAPQQVRANAAAVGAWRMTAGEIAEIAALAAG